MKAISSRYTPSFITWWVGDNQCTGAAILVQGRTTSKFSVSPPECVPPGVTLQECCDPLDYNRIWTGAVSHHFLSHLNPYPMNFFLVSSKVPGGERKTMWSSVDVDGVLVIRDAGDWELATLKA